MIDPKELRLENLLWLPGINRFVKVSAIFKTHFRCQDFDGISFDESIRVNYQPVELTPEILEAAGFTNGIKIIETSFLETEFYVDLMDGDAGFNKHGLWFPCKYLHQLQNLFWCLSRQELQIDINKLNKQP